jgi:hypothetical protein
VYVGQLAALEEVKRRNLPDALAHSIRSSDPIIRADQTIIIIGDGDDL